MTQIAVKISDEQLALIDEMVARGDVPSRSAAVREGLAALIQARTRLDLDRRFREGFAAHPETDQEMREARRLAIDAIDEEVWEKWW